ncbi:MAG: HAD family hydrolase [Chromatiales bacterium]|nr:HAD family hydrolase [Chromatiales bacterium]
MDLVLFDLDHTLLDGDSDFSWGEFLCEIGAVDAHYQKRNRDFYEAYTRGELDIAEYIKFSLQPLALNDMQQLQVWQQRFITEKIVPMVRNEAVELVAQYRSNKDFIAIITSTNSFITRPIGKIFGIETVIATEPELINGSFTGNIAGVPCFQEGKIVCLKQWLDKHSLDYQKSWFYSDSYNDKALLSWVDEPVVVNGDAELMKHAARNNWRMLNLR